MRLVPASVPFSANWFVFASSILLLLSACGGGGGGDDDDSPPPAEVTPTTNVATSSLTIETASPRIAYPLKGSVGYSSNRLNDVLEMSLFLVEKTDNPDAAARQFPLGSQTISNTGNGAGTIDFDLNIPSSVEVPGNYYLTAVVDPADEIVETDEEDNAFSIEVTLAASGDTNLFITDLSLDRNALEINTDSYQDQVNTAENNVYNADAGATLTVGTDGLAADESIDLEAFATLRMMRSDVGTTHNVPLYLWNTEAGRYINAYGVDPSGANADVAVEWLPLGRFQPQLVKQQGDEVTLEDVARNSTHMNFYFPGLLGSEMAFEMRYGHLPRPLAPSQPTEPPPDLSAQEIGALKSFLRGLPSNGITGDESDAMAVMDFAICVQIRAIDSSLQDTITEDNEVCSPLMITLPPVEPTGPPPPDLGGYEPMFSTPSGPLSSSSGYKTKGGGKVFAFGLDFGSSVSADNRGYIEQMYGSVPVTIFGKNFDFASIDVKAQLVPEYKGKPAGEESEFRIEINHAGQLLARIIEVPSDVQISLSLDELSFSKELPDPEKGGIAESTFFVGPIPLSAGAYVSGNLGVDYQPFVFTTNHPDGYRMGVLGGPYANIEATMYAALGSRRLPVSAGVEGVLSLLDERIEFFNGVEIDVVVAENATDPVEFVIQQGPKVSNIFTGPQGKINLFVRYTVPKIKTCKVKAGLIQIKIPCPGFVKLKATKNIYTSPALFKFKDVIFELPLAQLSVVVPEGKDPEYFVP